LIENLPKDSVVCHGDINPNNIMFCEGEYKFIDWVNAGIGNPLYDIAEYVWLNIPKEEANFDGIRKL
jgi:thiamine kinase-like enzyme